MEAYSEFTCGDIKIPSSHNGKPVKKLEDNSFYGCGKLTDIDIPEGIEEIREKSFSGCKKLKNIILKEMSKKNIYH